MNTILIGKILFFSQCHSKQKSSYFINCLGFFMMENQLQRLNQVVEENLFAAATKIFDGKIIDNVLFDLNFSSRVIQGLKCYEVSPALALKQFLKELMNKILNIYHRYNDIQQSHLLQPVPLDLPILKNHLWLKQLIEAINEKAFLPEEKAAAEMIFVDIHSEQFENVQNCFKEYSSPEQLINFIKNNSVTEPLSKEQITMIFQNKLDKNLKDNFYRISSFGNPKNKRNKSGQQQYQSELIIIDSNSETKKNNSKTQSPNEIKNQKKKKMKVNNQMSQIQKNINQLLNQNIIAHQYDQMIANNIINTTSNKSGQNQDFEIDL